MYMYVCTFFHTNICIYIINYYLYYCFFGYPTFLSFLSLSLLIFVFLFFFCYHLSVIFSPSLSPSLSLSLPLSPPSSQIDLSSNGMTYTSDFTPLPVGEYDGQLIIGSSVCYGLKKFVIDTDGETIPLELDLKQIDSDESMSRGRRRGRRGRERRRERERGGGGERESEMSKGVILIIPHIGEKEKKTTDNFLFSSSLLFSLL